MKVARKRNNRNTIKHAWYYHGGRNVFKQTYYQERKQTAPEQASNKFSKSGVLCKPLLQCGCGKKYKTNTNTSYQKHINMCDYATRGFCSTEHHFLESPGNPKLNLKTERKAWEEKFQSTFEKTKITSTA